MESGELISGRYRLDDPIGAGGMGEVWRATDTVLGRTVAIKILRPDLSVDSSFGARFRAEAHTLATLQHPGVVDVYDYGEVPLPENAGADRAESGATELAYVVMAYVEGEPLSRRIERAGRLSPAMTMSIVAQVADALHAAHAAGVVHRDVKPDNILINSDGRAVLVDFGVAHTPTTQGLTAVQDVIGTALYMAPEQAMKHAITPATDVYALASVAYECLTGVPPFTGDTPVSVALAHVHGTPSPLPHDVPPAARDVVTTGMAKNPSQRFPSAAAMAAAARHATKAADGRTGTESSVSAWPTGRAPVPLYQSTTPRQPMMRSARPDGHAMFDTSDGRGPDRSRSGLKALVVGATLAGAAAIVAVLVAMTSGSNPSSPSVLNTNTVTSTPAANHSTTPSGTARSTAPGAPGGSSATRTPRPTPTKTSKPKPPPTTPPITIPPSLPTGLPTPSLTPPSAPGLGG